MNVQYLQYLYIANNPFSIGAKQEMDAAGEDRLYDIVHMKYHLRFRKLAQEFGYHDLFLDAKKIGLRPKRGGGGF